MDWDELRTRVSQEVFKRLDLALYRDGVERGPNLKPYVGNQPKFFFCKDEIANRLAQLQKALPAQADAIIREADEICRHEFRLLGYENINYGPAIDWHSARRKDSPLVPWFKINFLDYNAVGDHKVIWELNRHQHLVTLAKASLLTGNSSYTNELISQWTSWQKANPYPLGINWASALEVAFRSLSWLWVRNLLADSPDVPATFQADLLRALHLHGRHIDRYLSTYFSPNTHLLGEAVALFFIGTLCPEIAAAKRWQVLGWKTILQESERQVRPDGVYFEQTLYYHVYALDFFLHARILAAANGLPIPQKFDDALKGMLDVLQALSAAGPIEGFGDDDGGRVFDPRRNRLECMTDPLALGLGLYGDEYRAPHVTEEAIWLFGTQAVEKFEKPPAQLDAPSGAFESSGIYFINDYEPCRVQMMIDAGPQGTGNSGHGHADALSIRLSVDGERFLVDSGTYCYVSEGEDREIFRGTAAHNTLRVDELDQAISQGPFAWRSLPRVTVEKWLNGHGFDFFIGAHDGYGRLPEPVLHRRTIFHVKGGLWFVRDRADGMGSHLLEIFWHFAPPIQLTEERGIILARRATIRNNAEGTGMAIFVDHGAAWTSEIGSGFVSPVYGAKTVAPVMRVSAQSSLPQNCGVFLLPLLRNAELGALSILGDDSNRSVRGYRFQSSQGVEFLFVAEDNTLWTCGPWTSDSKLLYCRVKRGRIMHVIMISGSFGAWQGKRFVSQTSGTESFEWGSRQGERSSSAHGDVIADALAQDVEIIDSTP